MLADLDTAEDSVSERLRRWTRNPSGSARRGSNPLAVVCLPGLRYLVPRPTWHSKQSKRSERRGRRERPQKSTVDRNCLLRTTNTCDVISIRTRWTHWDLNPGPSACEADVMPLHHAPLEGDLASVIWRSEEVALGRHLRMIARMLGPYCQTSEEGWPRGGEGALHVIKVSKIKYAYN